MNKPKTGKQNSRTVQNVRSARTIIIDMTSSSITSFCETIASSLEEFLSLLSNLPGAPKIQYLSLYMIGSSSYKCVLPLSHTRMHYQKMIGCVRDVILTCEEFNEDGNHTFFDENLESIFSDSMEEMKNIKAECSKNTAPSHVDFCFFTNQRHDGIEKLIAKVIKEDGCEMLKKVQVVRISNSDVTTDHNSQDSSGSTDSTITELICGHVESSFLEYDKLCFDQFFRKWLQECGTDDVHLSIQFSGFGLKCDLMDTMIDPANVSGGQSLSLETDVTFRLSTPPSIKNRQKTSFNIYTLIPQLFIRISGICESLLYGIPLIAKPTSCWKLDWEELEKNQAYFHSINSYLKEHCLALLLFSRDPTSLVQSYFIMLPSSGSTMLIKSIATRDIMMPRDACASCTPLKNDDISNFVTREFEKIVISNEYSPFSYCSNLFQRNANLNNNANNTNNNNASENNQQLLKQKQVKSIRPSLVGSHSGRSLYPNEDGNFGKTGPLPSIRKRTSYAPVQSLFSKNILSPLNADKIGKSPNHNQSQQAVVQPTIQRSFAKKASPWNVDISIDNDAHQSQLKKKKPRFEPPKTLTKKL